MMKNQLHNKRLVTRKILGKMFDPVMENIIEEWRDEGRMELQITFRGNNILVIIIEEDCDGLDMHKEAKIYYYVLCLTRTKQIEKTPLGLPEIKWDCESENFGDGYRIKSLFVRF